MCANSIIGNIYVNGTPSVKVVQYHRDSGSVFPCRWITLSVIYKKDRLIDIAADGIVTGDEIPDFLKIKDNLEQMSLAIDSLKLWLEQTVAFGEMEKKLLNK